MSNTGTSAAQFCETLLTDGEEDDYIDQLIRKKGD
jgi:hypothetical protein